MIFLTLLASIPFLKGRNKRIFYISLAAFILVGFQGWLGAKVVSFELMPIIVTLHMLVAIVIVFMLLYLFTWSAFVGNILRLRDSTRSALSGVGVFVMILSLIQILIGTQVREAIDEVVVKLGYSARSEWIEQLGTEFIIHRSFSIILLGANLYWINRIWKAEGKDSMPGKIATGCLLILIAEIGTGILMAYFGIPPFAQPLHLTFAILLIGLQFVIWLLVNGRRFLSFSKDFRLEHNGIL